MTRALARLAHEERGFALVFALGVMIVTSIMMVSIVTYSSSSSRTSSRSNATQVSYALAEAGVNNAMAVLSNPTNNALNSTLLPSTQNTYEGGTVTWSGALNVYTARWTITSTGRVVSPTGAADVVRTLSATVQVIPTVSQPLNSQAWNYVFTRNTGSTCDMTLANSVSVASPLYVNGNLCLQNTANITKGPLIVGGKLTLNTNNNFVGTSGTPINSAAIGNGCQKQSTSQNPCTGGSAVNIYATSLITSPPSIPPPAVDWNGWYLAADPGPYYPCTSVSGTPPAFDNDQGSLPGDVTKRNNSLSTVVDLTPASSYTCQTAAGALSWNNTTKVLTVSGTIFIDGSAKIQNGSVNSYVGFATIYLSGTLNIQNTKMCAVKSADGTTCSTSGWVSNSEMLVFVVAGNGSAGGAQGQVPSGDGIQVKSGYFQGALYANNAIEVATTSNVDGPLDGGTVILGQSVSSSWPVFTVVPAGMPGNPVAYAEPQTPSVSG